MTNTPNNVVSIKGEEVPKNGTDPIMFTYFSLYQAARLRHRLVFGHWRHDPYIYALYYGWWLR